MNRRNKYSSQRGVTLIEVLVALAILTGSLLMGIYPVWFYAGRQSVLASQETIARNLLEDQLQMYRFYDWNAMKSGALANTGAPPDLVNCDPAPNGNDPASMQFYKINVGGMDFNRVWQTTWPIPISGEVESIYVETWVYWRSAFGCRSIYVSSILNCNRGDYETGSYGTSCP